MGAGSASDRPHHGGAQGNTENFPRTFTGSGGGLERQCPTSRADSYRKWGSPRVPPRHSRFTVAILYRTTI